MSKRSRRFDDDDYRPPATAVADSDDDDPDEPNWSTYPDPDALHGPEPLPAWVITSPAATDDDLGVMKTGKEADVSLLRRQLGDASALLAVKRYRDAHHRMFHRDVGYLEGRRERRSRDARAIATRTSYGKSIIAARWAYVEFGILGRLWSAGLAVPYPVQLLGTELMMEFIGSPDGVAAPRLAQTRPDRNEAVTLYEQMRSVLVQLTDLGYAHGDLSPYNVLVDEGRLVLIDLPQAVDIVGNPQGPTYLRRDCDNICSWFSARGVDADSADLFDELTRSMPSAPPPS